MPEHLPPHFDDEDMALTDPDLIALYLMYPEMQQRDVEFSDEVYTGPPVLSMTSSSPEYSSPSTQVHSSPLPNLTDYDTPTSSPLGPPDKGPFSALTNAADEQEVDDLTAQFDLTLKSNEVPDDATEIFAEMKSAIMMMKMLLFSGTGVLTSDGENIRRVISVAIWLKKSLMQAQVAVEREINAIESILQLAPFTVRPAPEDLWTNFKQMAELIIQHTTISPAWMLGLYNQLCHIYDACVYRPILSLRRRRRDGDNVLFRHLDCLYNTIMVLPTRLRQWVVTMKRVGDDFTRPTLRKMLHMPEVMRQILESEAQNSTTTTQAVLLMDSGTKRA